MRRAKKPPRARRWGKQKEPAVLHPSARRPHRHAAVPFPRLLRLHIKPLSRRFHTQALRICMHQPKHEDSNAAIKQGMRLCHHAVTPDTNPRQDVSLKQLPRIFASAQPSVSIAQRLGRGRLASKLAQKPQHNAKIIIRFTVLSRRFKAMPSIYMPHGQAFFTEDL